VSDVEAEVDGAFCLPLVVVEMDILATCVASSSGDATTAGLDGAFGFGFVAGFVVGFVVVVQGFVVVASGRLVVGIIAGTSFLFEVDAVRIWQTRQTRA
jgi:hypothetical protein